MNTKNIKVLMIIGRLGDGGKERQLLLLLKTLIPNKNISTFLISMNSGGERETEASQLADYFEAMPGKRGVNFIKPLVKLVNLIKKHKIDVIHTWGSGVWDLIGLIAGRLCGVLVIHNGIQSAPNQLNIYDQITRFGALFADVVIANSLAGLQSFKLAYLNKSRVIHNGLELSRFENIERIKEGQNICMVANFRKEKDHKTAVLGFANITKQFPNANLHLIGHDYGTLSSCQKLVQDLNLENNIKFITNCISPELIIGKCQIGLLATHGEGISNALLECMVLTKPVIVSNNGGNPEVVIDGKTGFLVEPESPEMISEKLVFLLSKPDLAKTMGQNAEKSVKESFLVSRMVQEFTRLYRELSK